MTVRELRKILSNYDDNMEVCFEDSYRRKKLFLSSNSAEPATCEDILHNSRAFRPSNTGNRKVIVIK